MNVKDLFREVKYPIELFDSNGNKIYWENSTYDWFKREFDSNGNKIYYEGSSGYWAKREYDADGNEIYVENRSGVQLDKRKPTEMSIKELEEKLGIKNLKVTK